MPGSFPKSARWWERTAVFAQALLEVRDRDVPECVCTFRHGRSGERWEWSRASEMYHYYVAFQPCSRYALRVLPARVAR